VYFLLIYSLPEEIQRGPVVYPRITLPRHFDETLNMREKITSATQQ